MKKLPKAVQCEKSMQLRQAIEVNARTGWLSMQPAEFREHVASVCELRFLKAGERLTSLGDPRGSILGLAAGALNVHIASGPFPPFLCYIAYPGWWTGEAAAATGTPRRVEQVARLDSYVLAIPTDKLRRMANDDPETWRRLEQITVAHMDHALELACIRGGSDKRLKVLSILRRLAVQFPSEQNCVAISVNQSEIAEMSGLSRNSVGPVLSDLVQEGTIVQKYGLLEVNRRRLEEAFS